MAGTCEMGEEVETSEEKNDLIPRRRKDMFLLGTLIRCPTEAVNFHKIAKELQVRHNTSSVIYRYRSSLCAVLFS